ncbi:hypothetical protein JZ751_014716 [Albula glossodonta]|uniref:Secreted protein n=1 Tax=Albula glossodonta TaxID=121402 RepID=A0A8T2N456_9TELE|nr:hypothetical protein JZ751_014716 [Albula glossodonta]
MEAYFLLCLLGICFVGLASHSEPLSLSLPLRSVSSASGRVTRPFTASPLGERLPHPSRLLVWFGWLSLKITQQLGLVVIQSVSTSWSCLLT